MKIKAATFFVFYSGMAFFAAVATVTATTPATAKASGSGAEDKTITWVLNDFPPFIALNSNDREVDVQKAQGPIAEMYQELVVALPQYQHRFIRVPIKRAENFFQKRRQACTLLLQETPERSKYLTFGEEVAVSLPVGLITLQDFSRKNVTSQSALDLTKLLQSHQFRLGVVRGRSYSGDVDALVQRTRNSYSVVSDGTVRNLLMMLKAQRVNGVLAYYLEMAEFERTQGFGLAFQFSKVSEAARKTQIRASCEKSPWGQATLKDISSIVKKRKFKLKAHHFLLSVLPAERRSEYQQLYKSQPERAVLPSAGIY